MRTRLGLLLLAAVPLVATEARAQEAVTEQELTSPGSWGAKEGRTVELSNVKFRDFFQPNVRLVKIPADKLRLDSDRFKDLADSLARWQTKEGPLDRKGRSNVKITGIARDDASSGRVIEVTAVTRLPDDIDLYKKRLDALDGADADGRIKLAGDAQKRAELYSEDDLREWARALYDAALDMKRAALPKGDVNAAIDLAKGYRDLALLPNKAISLLGDLVLDSSIDQGERDKAAKFLQNELQAVLHRDKWISREDFKAALGYVPRRDGAGALTWVRRERIEFEQCVAVQRDANKNDPNLRKLLGSEYETAATNGLPTVGMYKQELVRTKGYGFPDQVDRFTEKSPGNGDLVWDQWIMADGSRFYFMNGILFTSKKKDVAWPKN
jgi:hypothetical protein